MDATQPTAADLDLDALRVDAEAARTGRWSYGCPRGSDAVEVFHHGKRLELLRYMGHANPQTVLALLDALSSLRRERDEARQEAARLREALEEIDSWVDCRNLRMNGDCDYHVGLRGARRIKEVARAALPPTREATPTPESR